MAGSPYPQIPQGERITYGFAGCPMEVGLYLGTVPIGDASWIAIRETGRGSGGLQVRLHKPDEAPVVFLNPALLTAIRPETDPEGWVSIG